MIGILRAGRQRGGTIATVALGCALALLSIQLMRPKPLSNAGLGVDWQCSKTAGILTICTKRLHAGPVFDSSRKDRMRFGWA
jgi:hypothetical protein